MMPPDPRGGYTERMKPSTNSGAPAVSATFLPLHDVPALDRAFADSAAAPVVVFLHDDTCPISGDAYHEVRRLGGEVRMIDVTRDHEAKRDIARRTGVRHESPQAFVLKDGHVAWSASHYKITTAALAAARAG